MALTITNVAEAANSTGSPVASSTFTPVAGRRYLIAVVSTRGGPGGAEPSLSATNGLQNFTLVSDGVRTASVENQSATSPDHRHTLWIADVGTPSSGTVTATAADSPNGMHITVDEVAGQTATPIVQVATPVSTDAGTSLGATLPSAKSAAGNMIYASLALLETDVPTLDTDFVDLGSTSHTSPNSRLQTTAKIAGTEDLTPTFSWTSSVAATAFAVEIEEEPTAVVHQASATLTLEIAITADAIIFRPGSPILAPVLESAFDSAGPWVPGSFDVFNGRGYLLAVTNWAENADPPVPVPDGSGVGLTWTQVQTRVSETTGVNRIRLTVFSAIASADDSGTISISFAAGCLGGAVALTSVSEYDLANFVVQSIADYSDAPGGVSSFEIGAGTVGTPLAAFADAERNAIYAAWNTRANLVSPTAEAGLSTLHSLGHDEPGGIFGDQTLFVAGGAGENLTPSASWSGDLALAVGGIALEIGARPTGVITAEATFTLELAITAAATIVGAPADIPGSSITIRAVRRVQPARVYVHQSNPARLRQVVLAATVNRSFATMKVTQCTFTIPSDADIEPMSPFLDPRSGRLIAVESSAYGDPWVGGLVEWAEDGAGKASILATSYDAIFAARILPSSSQVAGNVGTVFRELIATVNQQNDTGIAVAGSVPAGPRVEHDFGDYYLWDALTEMCRAIRWEWWVEYEVRPEAIYATAHLAPKRGEKRTDIKLVQGDRTIERLGSKINTAGVSHRIRVVGGQERTTQAFADRPRKTATIGDALLSADEIMVHGDRIEHSPLSATAFTRRDRVMILDHLRGQAAVDLATDRLLSEPRVAERMLMLRVLSDASNWEHVRPGNSILVSLPPPALISGYDGPVRVLETQPAEENGVLEFVAQILEEG